MKGSHSDYPPLLKHFLLSAAVQHQKEEADNGPVSDCSRRIYQRHLLADRNLDH